MCQSRTPASHTVFVVVTDVSNVDINDLNVPMLQIELKL